jgi:GNAT superfamily N-acetyltransferase
MRPPTDTDPSRISPCGAADFETILEIINESAFAYKGVIPSDRWHEPYMPRQELESEIRRGVRFYGYREGGVLIGVMGIQDITDVTLIRHAYVRTSRRGGGVGSALLRHLGGLTDRPILIGTWATATWAIQFYQRHGFRVAGAVERAQLLKTYWTIPERQAEESVVLFDPKWS